MSNVLETLIVKIGADIKDYSDGMAQATSILGGVSRTFESLGTNMSAMITAPMVGLGVAALETAGKFEQTSIAFTHFLGSVQASRAFLGDLYNFAATTPFQIGDITKGAQSLMAMGFAANQVVPMMRGLTDQLSAVGRTENLQPLIMAFGEMKAKGVASMKEVRQMVVDGVIPAVKYIAEGKGITEQDVFTLLKNKALSAGEVIKLVMAGLQRDTGGMGKEQMESLLGQLTNLKDKITFTLVEIGNTMLPIAKQVVALASGIGAAATDMAHAFATLPIPVQDTAFALAALAVAAGPAIYLFGSFAGAVRSAMAAWPALLTGLNYAASAFAALTSPIGLVVAAVAGVAAAMYIFRDATFSLNGTTYQLRDVWSAAWSVMGKAVTFMGDLFTGTVALIRGLWKNLAGWLSTVWGGAFGVVAEVIQTTVMSLLGWAKSVLGNLVPAWVTAALDEAKAKREQATAALKAGTAETDRASQAAKDLAAINELESESLGKKTTALEEAEKALAKVEKANRMGLATNREVRAAQEALTAAYRAANPQLTEWWSKTDQASFAMARLTAILNPVRTLLNPVTELFRSMAGDEENLKSATDQVNAAFSSLGALLDPLSQMMAGVIKQVNAWSDAFATLGITSSDTLKKQAADALAAYNVIRASGASTAHDIQEAWVAMEKARQAAAIAADQTISESEKRALQKAEADVGQHTKRVKYDWQSTIQSIQQSIESGLSNAITGVIFNTQKLGDAFKNIGKSIVSTILDGVIKLGLDALIAHMGTVLKNLTHMNFVQIMQYAHVAAAAAYAAVAGIPIIGPILAPVAAGVAYAGAAAFSALTSFDKGGYIAQDMVAQVHKGEYVLTAAQVASMSPSGGAQMALAGGNTFNANFYGITNPADMAEAFMANMKARGVRF